MSFFPGVMSSQVNDTVKGKETFKLNGNINLNLIGYVVSDIPERADPFSAILSANVSGTYKDLEIPISMVFSPYAFSASKYRQSFNQIGLSPKWRWITLHAGYRNVTFSKYTLAGHTFLGGGIELTPGLFRFGVIYGKFNRETFGSKINSVDTLPHYTRKGFAAKLGVGNKKNFLDLIFLRIRDDSTSITQADTVTQSFPEQNIVAGLNGHFTFTRKFTWDIEGAFSLYTNNLDAPKISAIEDDKTLGSMNEFFVINLSSEYYYAIRSSLQYKEKNWALKLDYHRIGPHYRSMGAYFFNTDVEKLMLSPSFALFKRKLNISGGIGLQRDNLSKTKRATSNRTIGNVNISCNPNPKFGVTTSYGNYSINQKDGRVVLSDTIRVQQASHNFSFSPRLFITRPEYSHMVLLVYNLSALSDKNKFTLEFTKYTSHVAQLNYIIGLLKSKWNLTAGLTYTNFYNNFFKITGAGGTIGVSKSLLENKMSVSWNNSLTRSGNDQSKGWIYNSNLSCNYQVDKHHNFRLHIYFTGNYQSSGSVNPSFNEMKGDLTYVFTF